MRPSRSRPTITIVRRRPEPMDRSPTIRTCNTALIFAASGSTLCGRRGEFQGPGKAEARREARVRVRHFAFDSVTLRAMGGGAGGDGRGSKRPEPHFNDLLIRIPLTSDL